MMDRSGESEYAYDSLGRIVKVTTGSGQVTSYAYDGADQLASITYPDGKKVSYRYDKNDNITTVTGRDGKETVYEYDAINRVTEIHRPNGISTYSTYNARDQIVTMKNICDDCGWVVSRYDYTYDDRGFITGETAMESLYGYAWDDKHDGRHENWHDELYPHGDKHRNKHDKDAEHNYQIIETKRSFTYDDDGRLLTATENEERQGTYVYRYTYDDMGNRLTYEKTRNGSTVESAKYTYNASNQLTQAKLYDGKKNTVMNYAYDGDGNLVSETGRKGTDKVELTYTYTVENRLKAVHDAHELLVAMAYDGDGNRVFQLNYNLHTDDDWKNNSGNGNGSNKDNTGSSKTVSLSALGLDDTPLAGVLSGLGSEAVEENSLLTAEEITAPELSLLTAEEAEALAASPAEAKLNENGNNGNNGDGGNGNHYGWEAGESGSEGGGSGSTGDTSDSSDTTGNGNTNNTGGSQNQSGILMPQKPVSEIEQSLIDEIRQTGHYKNYELIEYVNDVNRENTEVLMEANIDGAMDTAYTYGNERIALERFTGWTGYYTYDPRGSVSGVTDSEGKLWKSYRYSPTGDITFGKPQYNNSYSYNAEDYNPNLEVQYLRARYYDVERGNFLTEDPYLGRLTDPLSLNRYNYVKSSAPNYVDPSGYEAQSWVGLYDDPENYHGVTLSELQENLNFYIRRTEGQAHTSIKSFQNRMNKAQNKLSDLMNQARKKSEAALDYCGDFHTGLELGYRIASMEFENAFLELVFGKYAEKLGIYHTTEAMQETVDSAREEIKNHPAFQDGYSAGRLLAILDILQMASMMQGAVSGPGTGNGYELALPGGGSVEVSGAVAGEAVMRLPLGGMLMDKNDKGGSEAKKSGVPVSEKTKASNGLDYQSNPKHTPGQPGNRPNAGIKPQNSLELFGNSVQSTKNPNQRYTYDESTGTLHRFFNDGNGTWHWSGSTNQGRNSIHGADVPNDIKNIFDLPKKGW